MSDSLYFDDFHPGQTFDLGSYTVSRDDIVDFAAEFDPQPFHLDEHAGNQSLLGGLAASGWHTAALTMRLLCDGLLSRSHSQGSPGITELAWKRPVHPGDTIAATAEVLAIRPLKSKPDLGLVTIAIRVHNQTGVLVMSEESPILFLKRTAGA